MAENEIITVTMGQMVEHLYNAMGVLQDIVKEGQSGEVMEKAKIAIDRFHSDFGTESPLPVQ